MLELMKQPWPWYVAGPLIGLTVPVLLILGNKSLGISSSLRHVCAACMPGNITFFKYDWKKEAWNLFFVLGILIAGYLVAQFLMAEQPIAIHPKLASELQQFGIYAQQEIVPKEIFSWGQLLTWRGLIMMVGGGFLIGFGTRYAGGCTSGHTIMGLSNLQWPSLVATVSFMIGGIVMANFLLPIILSL